MGRALDGRPDRGARFIVHGLDGSAENVRKARERIRGLGLYGPVSIQAFTGPRLPYAENMVNLLVVEPGSRPAPDEMRRVLRPGGVALLREGEGWARIEKPWPPEIDEWTHWLHAADGNAVARDRVVGPPGRLQWTAPPLWARHHDTVPSTSAMVSSAGRLFTIGDEAPPCLDGSFPDKWFLVARDAFNGVLLWKRRIPRWGWSAWSAAWRGRFNNPVHLPKRLVAVDDRVFATLGFDAPLTALDAATGETVRVYAGTDHADEILYHDGLLVLSLSEEARRPRTDDHAPIPKRVCAVDPETGAILWKRGPYTGLRAKYNTSEPFGRLELTAGGGAVFLLDREAIVSLDLRSGRERWRIPRPPVREKLVMYGIRMSDQCVLVYGDGVLLLAQPEMKKRRSWHTLPGTLHAHDAADGRMLWKHPYGGWAHNWQPDVFVIDGLVWIHEHADVAFPGHEIRDKGAIDYAAIGLDLRTGACRRRISTRKVFDVGHHHRCYRGKATVRYLLPSRRGVEFIELATGENRLHHWARGACLHGIVPCNGLLYLSPYPCECYIAAKLNGYVALAPRGPEGPGGTRLERGPAYGARVRGSGGPAGGWPTFRHDPLRSGATPAPVPSHLAPAWRAAGGGIDTPPTIDAGRVLFGAADGWAYCLRAADGRLAWRRRVAPRERLVGARGQLESAWPVHGSILVQGGVAYLAAGRSSYLDGGIHLFALDPATGDVRAHEVLSSPDPETGAMPPGDARTIPGTLSDVLSGDGRVPRRQLVQPHALDPRPGGRREPPGLRRADRLRCGGLSRPQPAPCLSAGREGLPPLRPPLAAPRRAEGGWRGPRGPRGDLADARPRPDHGHGPGGWPRRLLPPGRPDPGRRARPSSAGRGGERPVIIVVQSCVPPAEPPRGRIEREGRRSSSTASGGGTRSTQARDARGGGPHAMPRDDATA